MNDETPEETAMINAAIERTKKLGAAPASRSYLLNLIRTMPPWLKDGLNDEGAPIDPREAKLNALTRNMAKLLDGHLGGVGFVLFLFEHGPTGFISYASNSNRDDVCKTLRHHLAIHDSKAESGHPEAPAPPAEGNSR